MSRRNALELRVLVQYRAAYGYALAGSALKLRPQVGHKTLFSLLSHCKTLHERPRTLAEDSSILMQSLSPTRTYKVCKRRSQLIISPNVICQEDFFDSFEYDLSDTAQKATFFISLVSVLISHVTLARNPGHVE